MAVIVEDGTIVADANSWVSNAEFSAYLVKLGLTPGTEQEVDNQLITSCNYINSLEPRLTGKRVSRDQRTAYPRANLEINGFSYETNEIPQPVKDAQLECGLAVFNGADLYNPVGETVTTRERVEGVVDVQYAVSKNYDKGFKSYSYQKYIDCLLKSGSSLTFRRA